MRPLFGVAVFRHHNDPIRIPDRRQPVGDDHRHAACGQLVQRLLDGRFRLRFEAEVASSRIRIGGFFKKHAGDGDPLFLPAGQFDAPLADFRPTRPVIVNYHVNTFRQSGEI